MADIWEKIKGNFESATEKAIELAKEAAEKTQKGAATLAVKIEIMKLEKRITEKLAKMGSLVHEMLKQGEIKSTDELLKLSEEIKELEDKLIEFKKVLEKKKKEEEKNNG